MDAAEFTDFAPSTIYEYIFPCGGEGVFRTGKEWRDAFINTSRDAFDLIIRMKMVFVPCGEATNRSAITVTAEWLREFWRRHNVI